MRPNISAPLLAVGALFFLCLAIWSVALDTTVPEDITLAHIEPQWVQHMLQPAESRSNRVAAVVAAQPAEFLLPTRSKTNGCIVDGPYPDPACTPGSVFTHAATSTICVSGYTKTVRSVSQKLREQLFRAYGVAYPPPAGAYELDHFIPLALGGDNSAANLFPEAAAPKPGFREKDVVEVYLYEEVCAGRLNLAQAQMQIAKDWLAVYNAMEKDEISRIRRKYTNWSN